ncbi:hypothetical protein [Citrobacter braakii]|uniref:hypothetical protein n=1 Tax=Citrobacter braakii TaxID=57706 RepID=UPI0014745B45|nr:hypothetical protein [Citrobacter braakii]
MVCVPRYLIRTPYNGVLASQTRHDYCPQSSMIRGDVTGSGGALVTANSPPRLANGSLSLVCIDILCHQASSDRTELVQRMLLTREVSVIRDRVAEQTTSYVDMFAALLAKRTCCDVGALQIRVVLRSRDSHR